MGKRRQVGAQWSSGCIEARDGENRKEGVRREFHRVCYGCCGGCAKASIRSIKVIDGVRTNVDEMIDGTALGWERN